MTRIVPFSVCPCTVRLLLRLSTHSKVIGIGLSSMLAAVGDAGLWSPSGCGGTDGLGILDVVSASVGAGLWSPSSSGSADDFASLLLLMVLLMSCSGPVCCGCDDAIGLPADTAAVSTAGSILFEQDRRVFHIIGTWTLH